MSSHRDVVHLYVAIYMYHLLQAYMILHDIHAVVESFEKALTLEPNDG